MPRADHAVMKWIYRNQGLDALMRWQSLPLVDLRERWEEITNLRVGSYARENPLPRLLFPLAVYAIPARFVRKTMWVTLSDLLVGDRVLHANLFWQGDDIAHAGHLNIRQGYEYRYNEQLREFAENRGYAILEAAGNYTASILALLIWLERTTLVPIEVKSSAVGKRMTAKIKPWVREDLPRVILIDPSEARRYGHRINHGGTHASPVPHNRRGGTMTLRHPRYGKNQGKTIWRKGTWVGDREWVHKGTTYKVLDTALKGALRKEASGDE